jgi:hypothetical protein
VAVPITIGSAASGRSLIAAAATVTASRSRCCARWRSATIAMVTPTVPMSRTAATPAPGGDQRRAGVRASIADPGRRHPNRAMPDRQHLGARAVTGPTGQHMQVLLRGALYAG